MAQPKFKSDPFTAEPAIDRPSLAEAGAHAVATPSPAHALHAMLSQSVAVAPAVEKWSPAQSIAFILMSASGLWMAILASGFGLYHAFA